MPTIIFKLPRLGGNESEARVLAWKKASGEAFQQGETLLEVETDKAVVDVPAPADGTLRRQLKTVDDIAEFDEGLAEIEVSDDAAALCGAATETLAVAAPGADTVDTVDTVDTEAAPAAPAAPAAAAAPVRSGRVAASPAARAAARAAGVDGHAFSASGSGPNGRIVKADVRRAGAAPVAAGRAVESMVDTHQGEVFVRRWPALATAGPTLVLIHGLFGDADAWAGVANTLAEAGHPVLALDLPAHGRTRASGRTVDEAAAVVSQVLAALAVGPVLLVGHSLGGAVATRVAQSAVAGTVQGLLLIAPAGLGSEINQGFIDGMQHAGTPALLRRELAKLAQRLPQFGDALVAEMHRGLRERAVPLADLVAGFARHGVQQVDIRPVLDALPLPVAVLWGRADQVLPWTHALNLPPRVALHLFADAGHMPQWETGRVVAELIVAMARRGRVG